MNEEVKIIENPDVVSILLDKNLHPVAWERKMRELTQISGMTENEAESFLNTNAFVMELYYDISRGLFAVESEAVECCEIYNPYTGDEIAREAI